jgi:hypothetical protein
MVIITINVPVVYTARDVMILMQENTISRATGRGGPRKSRPFGLKKVKIFRAHPFQWLSKCIFLHKKIRKISIKKDTLFLMYI